MGDFNFLKEMMFNGDYSKSLQNIFSTMFLPTTPDIVKKHVLNNIKEFKEEVATNLLPNSFLYDYYAIEKALKQINVPVLIIQSTLKTENTRNQIYDEINARSDWLDLVQKNISGVEIELVINCGHFIMLERPDLTNNLINKFVNSSWK